MSDKSDQKKGRKDSTGNFTDKINRESPGKSGKYIIKKEPTKNTESTGPRKK